MSLATNKTRFFLNKGHFLNYFSKNCEQKEITEIENSLLPRLEISAGIIPIFTDLFINTDVIGSNDIYFKLSLSNFPYISDTYSLPDFSSSGYILFERITIVSDGKDLANLNIKIEKLVNRREKVYAEIRNRYEPLILNGHCAEKKVFIHREYLAYQASWITKIIDLESVEKIQKLIECRNYILENFDKIAPEVLMLRLFNKEVSISISDFSPSLSKNNKIIVCRSENKIVLDVEKGTLKIIDSIKRILARERKDMKINF